MYYRPLLAIMAVAFPLSFVDGSRLSRQRRYAANDLALSSAESSHPDAIRVQGQEDDLMTAKYDCQKFHNSEDWIDEFRLLSNIRQGKIQLVAPNIINPKVLRSLLTPTNYQNHQIISTQPLRPEVVYQPAVPPTHVNIGSVGVIKAMPVIYTLKPSVIYQHEVINKIPAPISLNPVYVKVYKPDRDANDPLASDLYGARVHHPSAIRH